MHAPHDPKFGEGAKIDPDAAENARKKQQADAKANQANNAYTLRGASTVGYATRAVNGSDSLLSDRWLCRGCGAFLIAPSGQGKSTLTIQAAACFACGLPAFGLEPSQVPLRSLIVQAEDVSGDLIEMCHAIDHLGLTAAQRALVDQHTWIETVNHARGPKFIAILNEILQARPADLLWINPYAVYLGAPIRDDDANNEFLYVWLNPILEKHNCGALIPAHTPKTQFRDKAKFKTSDWMYSGAGAAVITQWARGVIVIDPTEVPGVFRFIAAKREKRLAWPNNEMYWAHSGEPGKILWVPASKEQVNAAINAGKGGKHVDLDKVLELVPLLDPELKSIVLGRIMRRLNYGRDLAKEALKVLQFQQKIFTRLMDNGQEKKGRRFEGWSRTSEEDDI